MKNKTKKLFKLIEENEEIKLTDEFKTQLEETFNAIVQEEKDKHEIELKEKDGEKATIQEKLDEANSTIEAKNEEIKKIKEVTLKTVKEEVEAHKSELVDKLDSFLESELESLVPEEVVEATAKVAIYEPIVEGIRSTFSSKGVEVNSDAHEVLKEAKKEIETLREDVNKATSEKIALESKAEELLAKYVLKEKCEGLTVEQIAKVENIFKGDSVETIEEKFDTVRDLVIENKEEDDGDDKTLVLDEGVAGETPLVEEDEDPNSLGQHLL